MGAESRLLYDERPLVVIPELACAIGLNNAIVLQQVHYWVRQNQRAERNFHNGYFWTYNTFEAWGQQFRFWSVSTIKRIFAELEEKGLLVTGHYNKLSIDRTTWYRIDYERLADSVKLTQWKGQSDTMHSVNVTRPLPEINTDILGEKKIEIWSKTIKGLKDQVNKSNFRTWLKDLEPLSFDGEVFVIGAGNVFIAEYLERNLRSLIEKELTTAADGKVQVVFQIGTAEAVGKVN